MPDFSVKQLCLMREVTQRCGRKSTSFPLYREFPVVFIIGTLFERGAYCLEVIPTSFLFHRKRSIYNEYAKNTIFDCENV